MMTTRVSRKNPKLDFEIALYVFPLLGDTLIPQKNFEPLACFKTVPQGPPKNLIFGQILLYKIPKFLPIFLKVS